MKKPTAKWLSPVPCDGSCKPCGICRENPPPRKTAAPDGPGKARQGPKPKQHKVAEVAAVAPYKDQTAELEEEEDEESNHGSSQSGAQNLNPILKIGPNYCP